HDAHPRHRHHRARRQAGGRCGRFHVHRDATGRSDRGHMRLTALLISALALASAQTTSRDLCTPPPGGTAPSLPARIMTGQGRLRFPITTSNPKAQEFFEQGVAQMHSFWAVEAERSFLQAAALDPEAPMPQWGIAMAAAGDYRPRFQLMGENAGSRSRTTRAEGAAARAATAAKKAVELSQEPGKATALEKLYIAAIAARRDPNEKDPDEAYIRGLRAVVAAYPDEV